MKRGERESRGRDHKRSQRKSGQERGRAAPRELQVNDFGISCAASRVTSRHSPSIPDFSFFALNGTLQVYRPVDQSPFGSCSSSEYLPVPLHFLQTKTITAVCWGESQRAMAYSGKCIVNFTMTTFLRFNVEEK